MLDLVVYAPLGLLVSVTEELPALVEKGRQRATLARMMGEMAAPEIQKEAGKLLQGVLDRVMPPGPPPRVGRDTAETSFGPDATKGGAAAHEAPALNGSSNGPARRHPTAANGSTGAGSRVAPADPAAAAALAIPGYDSLSAMQVVQRLPGLTPEELAAVRAYEARHRGRKTILNRADQLLSGSPS